MRFGRLERIKRPIKPPVAAGSKSMNKFLNFILLIQFHRGTCRRFVNVHNTSHRPYGGRQTVEG